MSFAVFELGIGIVALAWLSLFIWSLSVIVTTPDSEWPSSGVTRLLWLIIILIAPVVGSILFLTLGRSQLRHARAS